MILSKVCFLCCDLIKCLFCVVILWNGLFCVVILLNGLFCVVFSSSGLILCCYLVKWYILCCDLIKRSVLCCDLVKWSVLCCDLIKWSVLFCDLVKWSVLCCYFIKWSVLCCDLIEWLFYVVILVNGRFILWLGLIFFLIVILIVDCISGYSANIRCSFYLRIQIKSNHKRIDICLVCISSTLYILDCQFISSSFVLMVVRPETIYCLPWLWQIFHCKVMNFVHYITCA